MDQILAVIAVRFQLLRNTLRHKTSGWESLASGLTILGALVLSFGVATVVGLLVRSSATSEDPGDLRLGLMAAFWICTGFGIMMPLILSTGASAVDVTRLRTFPITRRKLGLMTWVSAFFGIDHLFYYPSLLAAFAFGVAARDSISGLQVILFLAVPVIIVTWSMALVSLVQGLLRTRRSKEVVSLVALILIVSASMAPTFFTHDMGKGDGPTDEQIDATLNGAELIFRYAPPNLAADGISAIFTQTSGVLPRSLLGLGLWFLLGGVTAYGIFLRSLRGEESNSGSPQKRKATSKPISTFDITRWLPFIPAPTLAIASKELRYMKRSTIGKFNVLMIPLLCGMFAVIFKATDTGSKLAEVINLGDMTLYGILLYAMLFTNNFVNNFAAWDGSGFKLYLLAPVSPRAVLIGKNLSVWIFSGVMFVEVIVTWSLIRTVPDLSTLMSAAFLYAASMVVFTAAGNFASMIFPIPRDISLMKNQPSQAAVLLSILTLIATAGVVFFFTILPVAFGFGTAGGYATVVSHLVYLILAALGYRLSLRFAADLFVRNSTKVLTRLEAGV
jgi:ABC-2 type transport system permease protein